MADLSDGKETSELLEAPRSVRSMLWVGGARWCLRQRRFSLKRKRLACGFPAVDRRRIRYRETPEVEANSMVVTGG